MSKETIGKWRPSGLLDNIEEEDLELVILNMEYIASKLVTNENDLDAQMITLAIPMIIRLHNLDSNITRTLSPPIIWSKMKKVFNDLELSEPVGYLASDLELKNMETFTEKLYDELINFVKEEQE